MSETAPSCAVGDLGGATEGGLGVVAIEEVALHVQHVAVGDRHLVEVGRTQQAGHPEVGVHRPLGIRRDDDDAPARGNVGGRGSWPERHPDGVEIVAEHGAEIVAADLADVGGPTTEAGDPAHRVGRRSAAHLHRSPEGAVQLDGPIGVDQGHRALDELVVDEEAFAGVGDDVDERIADADDLVAGRARRRSGVRHVGQRYRCAATSPAPRPVRLPRP